MNKKAISIVLILILLALACSSTPTATTPPEPVEEEPTSPPAIPTATTIPTITQTSTPSLTSTATTIPTFTLTFTVTPTATPPFEKIVLTGTGDSIVDVDKPADPAIIHITGNSAKDNFIVESYDTEPYDGWRPLDVFDNQHTFRLQITAVGDWTVEILPLQEAHRLIIPGTYTGSGDDIFFLFGEGKPDVAKVKGNASSLYFGVFAYSSDGYELLVNTTDPYEGSKILNSGTFAIEVVSEEAWEIIIETK
jgi:hypothetical protein